MLQNNWGKNSTSKMNEPESLVSSKKKYQVCKKKQEIMAHNQENNQFLRNTNNRIRGEKILKDLNLTPRNKNFSS